jgi:hypothetical protein
VPELPGLPAGVEKGLPLALPGPSSPSRDRQDAPDAGADTTRPGGVERSARVRYVT